jgi:hypothetical protein
MEKFELMQDIMMYWGPERDQTFKEIGLKYAQYLRQDIAYDKHSNPQHPDLVAATEKQLEILTKWIPAARN